MTKCNNKKLKILHLTAVPAPRANVCLLDVVSTRDAKCANDISLRSYQYQGELVHILYNRQLILHYVLKQ